MLAFAPHLPHATVGCPPGADRPFHHRHRQCPLPIGQAAAPRVQVDRADHGTPHVVLGLAERSVTHPHRTGPLVTGEFLDDLLIEVRPAVDAVHDLQVAGGAGDVADEVQELVGLRVEAERVQRPQGQGGVAHPGEPVVPVPLAARRLGQGRRGRGRDRAGRGVGEALEGDRRALQEAAPRVVREAPAVQPVLPVMNGPHQPGVRLRIGTRPRLVRPRQRDEPGLALAQQAPGGRQRRTLEPQVEVGVQAELEVRSRGGGQRLVVAAPRVAPDTRLPAVVEHRKAVQPDLNPTADAADRA